jgi:hypothetical protein
MVVDCLVRVFKERNPDSGVSILFYADDGVLSCFCAETLQRAVDQFTTLFSQVGLQMNAKKTKAMICTPGHIPIGMSSPGYLSRMTKQPRVGRPTIVCPLCSREMLETSLKRHMANTHQQYAQNDQTVARRLFDSRTAPYHISVPLGRTIKVECPVEMCRGTANNAFDMRKHFLKRHPKEMIIVEEEGRLTQCRLCGMFVAAHTLANHGNTKLCRENQVMIKRRAAVQRVNAARGHEFHVGDIPLETVGQFSYLGRIMLDNDSDMAAAHSNIKKARSKWRGLARGLARVLNNEGADPKTMVIFYRAVILAVLLYGSETWVMTEQLYRTINSFHVTISRQISRLPIRYDEETDSWVRPSMERVFQLTGLRPLYDYVHIRRQYIQDFAKIYMEKYSIM